MLISKTKININKIIGLSFLLLILISVLLPFRNTFAVVTITAEAIQPTSVVLKATGLTPGQTVTLWVINKNSTPPTPSYTKSYPLTASGQGVAFYSFTGLYPNGTYRGHITATSGVVGVLEEFKTLKSSEKSITSFTVVSGFTTITGVINNVLGTISLEVPFGTAITYLTPTIVVSDKATVSPASLVSKNFNNPVDYTVTAEDGSTWSYRVTVTVAAEIPVVCTSPAVRDPATNTCTCTPPATLDTTTNTCITNTKTTYTLLAPLPFMGLDGTTPTIDTLYNKDTNPCPFGKYLNILIKLFLGICGVLAVIMIVWGGIQYMTSELASSKEEGKKSIINAILGLLLALGAWLILNTINPDLLNVCLNNLPLAEITIGPESVTNAGPGVNIDGTIVKISNGSAVTCVGGIVSIPSNMGSGQICKDLLDRLQVLKSKTSSWKINSTIRDGKAASSCHYSNSPNSGNCADLQITDRAQAYIGYNKDSGSTNSAWGDFCVAVAQTGGLNFLNEAAKVEKCEKIINYQAYAQTTGPHLHVNYIGDSSLAQGEIYSDITANSTNNIMVIFATVQNYDRTKNHRILVWNTDVGFSKDNPNVNNASVIMDGTSGDITVGLTTAEWNKVKGKPVYVRVWSASVDKGTRSYIIPVN